ncbi:MAG: glycosyltransferase family 4 protein [Bacteroidia bacterium]|nr:glycosyltransferase family 4 protein [Bacteroidia bacterium]
MKLLVLYEELAGYFLACIRELTSRKGTQILIIASSPNPVAPFDFPEMEGVEILYRDNMNVESLQKCVATFRPDVILCGGWRRKEYRRICSLYKHTIPVVLGFDNPWTGSMKQRLLSLFAGAFVRQSFTCAWVPGNRQVIFARQLGFRDAEIYTGAYCADTHRYEKWYEELQPEKSRNRPRRFVFSGRYTNVKNVEMLWDAFTEAKSETGSDWELYCLGKGDIKSRQEDGIRHLGFVQPEDMLFVLKDTSVFVLPSTFEPWGVVVHEFAAAGYPLLLSSSVGAAEVFLENGKNGFLFEASSRESLKNALKHFMNQSEKEWRAMSDHSMVLSRRISPAKWGDTLCSFSEKHF